MVAIDIRKHVSNIPSNFLGSEQASKTNLKKTLENLNLEVNNQVLNLGVSFPPYLWAFSNNMQITEALREIKMFII